MKQVKVQRRLMLMRLEEYARLREDGLTSWDAITELGMSVNAASRYERWYRRERLHLDDHDRGTAFRTWMQQSPPLHIEDPRFPRQRGR